MVGLLYNFSSNKVNYFKQFIRKNQNLKQKVQARNGHLFLVLQLLFNNLENTTLNRNKLPTNYADGENIQGNLASSVMLN